MDETIASISYYSNEMQKNGAEASRNLKKNAQ